MGKRSNFKKHDRSYYPTPMEALVPLLPFLPQGTLYVEPCAGNGQLIDNLRALRPDVICSYACDIKPMAQGIIKKNALNLTPGDVGGADFIVTNPPWDRNQDGTGILHQMIPHFTRLAPTWLLFDADWMHTVQSIPHMAYCRRVVSVGRVKWFPDSDGSGKDNAAWYQFLNVPTDTQFIPRQPSICG